jgi:kinesin family protein 5
MLGKINRKEKLLKTSEHYCSNEKEVLDIMKVGANNRVIAVTNMNEHSSRSHSIFIMQIHQFDVKDSIAKVGKLYLVLA